MMLGLGAARRDATDALSGSTWYFFASVRKMSFISFTLSGYLLATSSHCVQSSSGQTVRWPACHAPTDIAFEADVMTG
jgi:hypothetical protein